jgi:adenylate cyclase
MSTAREVAILFADVSDSVRLYVDLGDKKALELIGKCVEVMTEVTRRFGGRVIKTIGDEIMAAFPTGTIACEAAIELHFAVCDHAELAAAGLGIHCGFHFGEVMVTEGDVFGDTVNIAARLAEASKGGQILTSGEVMRTLPEALTAKTRYIDAELLKGRVNPLELYEVIWQPDSELTAVSRVSPSQMSRNEKLILRYRGKQYELADTSTVIVLGRDARATITIFDTLASRTHGRIEIARGRFVYTDFSSNGSFVQLEGEEEAMVRRDSITLRDRGTISVGRPARDNPENIDQFETALKS